jgi:hypothetical protein
MGRTRHDPLLRLTHFQEQNGGGKNDRKDLGRSAGAGSGITIKKPLPILGRGFHE